MEIIVKSVEETEKLARQFTEKVLNREEKSEATVMCLEGDLGSGKTVFAKGIAHTLGVQKEFVTSPTFVIQKTYDIDTTKFKKLIHIDAYRFENEKEASVLNLEALFKNPQNLIIIEWPEKMLGHIPEDVHKIKLTFIDDSTRKIESHAPVRNRGKQTYV